MACEAIVLASRSKRTSSPGCTTLKTRKPLLITREGVIIDGYARKEVAHRLGIPTLSCLELDMDEEAAKEQFRPILLDFSAAPA